MTAQETIDEIRRSRVVGSVTIKTEEEKPKIKSEQDLISSNMRSYKRTHSGGHCPKHCPKAKRMKTYKALTDPDDTLPNLPATHPTETRDNTPDTTKPSRGSKTSLRSGVTERTASKVSKTADTTDTNEPVSEQNVVT